MITVQEVVEKYHNENNLPPASKKDLLNVARMVIYHFKNYWAKEIFTPGELIPCSGFLVTDKDGERIIENAYPNEFEPEMRLRIAAFIKQKEANIAKDEEQKKKIGIKTPVEQRQRKRIPIKSEPLFKRR